MTDPLLQQISSRAAAFHEAYGITQKRIARELGMDSTAYCRFLKRERDLSLDRVARLLELTSVPTCLAGIRLVSHKGRIAEQDGRDLRCPS
jgi:transcriptional regulator with XRE-family HTH domain